MNVAFWILGMEQPVKKKDGLILWVMMHCLFGGTTKQVCGLAEACVVSDL